MADETTTTDTQPPATEAVVDKNQKMQAEVRCAGVVYFDRVAVRDPWGEISKDPNGNEVYALDRSMAGIGEIIELSPYEFQRLSSLGAVQEVGSSPLPGAPGQSALATPFTTPVPPEGGEIVPWMAPVMGDPRPGGAGTADRHIVSGTGPGGALTAEELIELAPTEEMKQAMRSALGGFSTAEAEAIADGKMDPTHTQKDLSPDEQDSYDSMMELDKPDLEAEVSERGLEVTRADGRTDLSPRKEDLARALAVDDHKEGGETE
jgi:hypothetical protein